MEKLEAGHFYHIYNRGNNKQDIFFEDINYEHFLKLLSKYLIPISKIYCYCLLKNHFHILLQIKVDCKNSSQAFSNFFNAYTKAINKKYNRSGSLFQKPFKRIKITDENYLKALILYIHLNPEKHGLDNTFDEYEYSSYLVIISQSKTNISKNEVINWFEDIENFQKIHFLRKIELTNNTEKLFLE